MPTVGKRRGGRALCGLELGLLLLTAQSVAPARGQESAFCKYFSGLPDDCAGAEHRRFDDLRDYRYEEIDLFAKDPLKRIVYVSVYNTTGLNGGDDSHDSAPASLAQKLDPKKIAKQYQALSARIGPPHYWTVDWLADRIGAVRNFDGLNAAWMGNSQAPSPAVSPKAPSPAYRTTLAARTAVEGFKKGSEVYLLDDPKGRTWVMVSYTNKDMPDLTIDKLDSLGDLLKLPQGWKFRTATLAKELILEPKAGFAGITQDDKGNVYHLTGARQSNFTP
jgi:hypothetical protein